jgi:hypothetical protein
MNNLELRINEILLRAGVAPDNIPHCLEWAFGPDPLSVPIYPDWVTRWSKLHPHAFKIHRKDSIVEVLYVIGHVYTMLLTKGEIKNDSKDKARV